MIASSKQDTALLSHPTTGKQFMHKTRTVIAGAIAVCLTQSILAADTREIGTRTFERVGAAWKQIDADGREFAVNPQVITVKFKTGANRSDRSNLHAALGYSEVELDPDTVDISVGPVETLKASTPVHFSEEEAKAYLENETVEITVNLHVGNGSGKAWGCDLTYDYVRINAGYRT